MNTETNEHGVPERSSSTGRATSGPEASDDHMIDEGRDERLGGPEGYRLQFDPEAGSESTTELVRAIADAAGDEPTSMEPLYRTIDPDLIELFLERRPDGGTLEFTFHGFDVTIGADGEILLRPADG